MKKTHVLTMNLLFLAAVLGAQEVVKNPDKPANPKAGRILALKEELRTVDRTPTPNPVEGHRLLVALPDDTRQLTELASFPVRMLFRQGAFLSDNIQAAVMDARYAFVTHANPYSIKIFDCRERRLLRAFSRPYKRVPRPKDLKVGAIITSDGKTHEMPGSESLEDVVGMFVAKDRVWVRTSTRDVEKGMLIDVFDLSGRYVDMFYLKTAGRLLAVDGDAVFIVEKTADETLEIAKYRIDE